MKTFKILICTSAVIALLTGCQTLKTSEKTPLTAILAGYAPDRIEILGLSELKVRGDGEGAKLKMFVTVLDKFNSSVKYPGIFRFELYDYVPRSPMPKGKRVETWPDLDLTEAVANSAQFQEYLKAYEFDLDINAPVKPGQIYRIEASFTLPNGKRINTEANIRYQQ